MIFNLKYITRLNLPVAILLSAVALAGWVPDFIAGQSSVGALVSTMLLTLVNGLGLMYLLYATSITRYREPLPVVLYLLCTAVFFPLHPLWQAQLAVTALIMTVVILHHCYHRTDAQEQVFLATGLLLVGSLLSPEMVWYVPLLWAALIYQQALTVRSLMASMVAIGGFALYYAIAYYYIPSCPLYPIPLPELPVLTMEVPVLSEYLSAAACLVIGLYFAGHLLWRLYRESNRMRFVVILHIVLLLAGGVWALLPSTAEASSLPTMGYGGLALLIYPFALLATLFFRQKESVFRGILFLVLLALLMAAYIL